MSIVPRLRCRANKAWVTDITYIRTHEGWLYLSVVLDLFSRQVVGWSMSNTINKELVLNALLSAVWRRRPAGEVIIHSDSNAAGARCRWTSYPRQTWYRKVFRST